MSFGQEIEAFHNNLILFKKLLKNNQNAKSQYKYITVKLYTYIEMWYDSQ